MKQTSKWEARRKEMLERFITAWQGYEDVTAATDTLVVAHVAAAFQCNGGPARDWDRSETKSMERLVKASTKYKLLVDDPEIEKELKIALDELALAHMAATFEWASGPLKW
jgi:hypothetical protein